VRNEGCDQVYDNGNKKIEGNAFRNKKSEVVVEAVLKGDGVRQPAWTKNKPINEKYVK
jgi:hypothetical protein